MSESRLSTSLITYGESLLRLHEARAEEARARLIFTSDPLCHGIIAEFVYRTKAAEDVFHVAADELAEAWEQTIKNAVTNVVAAMKPENGV